IATVCSTLVCMFCFDYVIYFLISFFFYCYGAHRDLHSFPTRRSSDLERLGPNGRIDAHQDVESGRRSGLPAQPSLPCQVGQSARSEEHTSELQSRSDLVCRLLLEKKKEKTQGRPRDLSAVSAGSIPHA